MLKFDDVRAQVKKEKEKLAKKQKQEQWKDRNRWK